MQSLADAIVQAHASNNVRSPPKPIPLPRKTKGIAGKARATEHPSARAEGGRLINALKLLQEQSSPRKYLLANLGVRNNEPKYVRKTFSAQVPRSNRW